MPYTLPHHVEFRFLNHQRTSPDPVAEPVPETIPSAEPVEEDIPNAEPVEDDIPLAEPVVEASGAVGMKGGLA